MSTTKKLSRELEQMAATGDAFCNVTTHEDVLRALAAEARALEERVENYAMQVGELMRTIKTATARVEELEDVSRAKGTGLRTFGSQLSKATARAEQAEKRVAELEQMVGEEYGLLKADRHDAATARAEAAETKWKALDHENDALCEKLAAAEARELIAKAEVARLRKTVRNLSQDCDDDDRLNDELGVDVSALRNERDALQRNLEKVRAVMFDGTKDYNERYYACARILDGDAGDDTFYEATKRLGWGDNET